ncbi:ABC transporter substrate-binding protein [Actinocorallia sp. API 0066]|uniref:ABC transporter substrate-binding protein n=1 Tax=Actinocorallia sp. API 0066 TaxID=2896846 RepID=UPI001E3747B9|nr:ABC transporter substrate-binding protein [Actinocorallia sp. API 0066]MCD0449716.1 ABC transporter substrate-binding protein [Actinocorallia sp. API 0066]
MPRRLPVRRDRAHLRIAVATALLATGLTACSSAPAENSGSGNPVAGGTLNVMRANPFEGFELDKQTLNSSFQISDAVLEPLIRAGADGKTLEPGLAASWSYNAGNTVLTLKLQPDAVFSDGTPVTAEDVVFSAETWKSGSNYGATYAVIAKAKAVDEHTVEFRLAYPDTALPAFLSWSSAGVVPDDFGGKPAKEFWQKPVGAGAFTVEKWSANGEVVLKKNPRYWRDGLPHLDQVVSTFAADPNTIGLRLRSGQADMADEIWAVTASTLPKEYVKSQPEHLTPVLLMNTEDPALADPKVRQAIGYALDYSALVTSAYKGFGTVPSGALPTNSKNWAAPSKPYFAHDPAKAKSLLGTAGPAKLTLHYANDPSSGLVAQIVQRNLGAVGVTVELQSGDASSTFATVSGGDYQLGMFSYNAISPDVSDPAWYVAGTRSMFTGLNPDPLVAALGDYAGTDDVKAKAAAVTRVQDILFEQAPFLALAHVSALEGQRTVVKGAEITPWGTYYLDTVWKSE